jgi:hypothetical protein
MACLALAATQPQQAHAEPGCSNWVKSGQWFGCGYEGEWGTLQGGINAGGGNHNLCVAPFRKGSNGYEWPDGWACGNTTVYYEHFALFRGFESFYNDGSAEVNGYVTWPA